MRRFRLLAVLLPLTLWSCDNDSPMDHGTPAVPAIPSPPDRSVDQPSSLTLSWRVKEGADRYDVYLGKSPAPSRVVKDLTVLHYRPARLTTGSQYYWRVVSKGPGGEVQGPLWSFTTGAGVPPGPPSQPVPESGDTVALDPVILKWLPEPGDSLAFDVYFGTSSDPPLFAGDATTNSYSVPAFAGNTYYWRVESKNLDGLVTSGPTWHFVADHVAGHMYNVAGTGHEGFGATEQAPLNTQLYYPQDLAFDPAGYLIIVDWNNHRLLGINPGDGTLYLVAGTLDGNPGEPCPQYPGLCDGVEAIGARINHPTSITFSPGGMIAMSAWHNYQMLLIDPAGSIMTRVAGTGKANYDGEDKSAIASAINLPSASVYNALGELIFTDQYNSILRRVDAGGVIHLFAGQPPLHDGTRWVPQRGFSGDEGPAVDAKFKWDGTTTCGKLAIDASGNIYVADTFNHAVRRIDTSGIIHRFAGVYPASEGFSGDGGPASSAQLKEPRDVACDSHGNVFIADTGNHVIRMVAPDGVITTVAGTPGVTGTSLDDGRPATESGLDLPFGIAVDAHDNLWIADTHNSRIRVVYR